MLGLLRSISSVVTNPTRNISRLGPFHLVRQSSIFSPLSQCDPGTSIRSPHNVNWIQKRDKHVIYDAAEPHRVYKYSKKTGKRTSAAIVPRQFYKLHWGGWIRTVCGRDITVHKKKNGLMRKLRQHVFCNGQQSHLLDRLVLGDPYFRKRHYYVDDEYEPYHSREEFKFTRTKPLPPSPDIEKYL